MRNIGIVRRLDELGRIVIPREFRKTHRINVGDPLEITSQENGNIMITKVDMTSDLAVLCETACASLSSDLNKTIAASTFDTFITVSGQGKATINERYVPGNIAKLIKNRGIYNGLVNSDELGGIPGVAFKYVCIVPIHSYDECFGGLFAFSDTEISALEAASLKLAGKLIGETMAKY